MTPPTRLLIVFSMTCVVIPFSYGRFSDYANPNFLNYFRNNQYQDEKIEDLTYNLKISEVDTWPSKANLNNVGQLVGVAANNENVYLFDRRSHIWDENSFGSDNIYRFKNKGPINDTTVLVVDAATGQIKSSWGSNRFFMPHGISNDPQGNIWVTDVALHQAFRFKADQLDSPDLVLGEAFVPGDDERHFCKPTDVAVSSSGIVYVSDGYCNSRIAVFSPDGTFITDIGSNDGFMIAHSLTLLENEDLICVADRENQRVLCYTAGLNGSPPGKVVFNLNHPQIGRVFAIDHIGDTILAVNGPDGIHPSQGLALDLALEQLVNIWSPKDDTFKEPHDVAISPNGKYIYVVDIGSEAKKKIYKFSIQL